VAHGSQLDYSVRNDFTGFAIAALMAWKATVIMLNKIVTSPAAT
jgi:hypothetical protein